VKKNLVSRLRFDRIMVTSLQWPRFWPTLYIKIRLRVTIACVACRPEPASARRRDDAESRGYRWRRHGRTSWKISRTARSQIDGESGFYEFKKMKFMNFSRVLKMPSEFYFEIRYINFYEKLQSHLLSRRNAQQ